MEGFSGYGGERIGEERTGGVREGGDDLANAWRVCGRPRGVTYICP